MKWFVCLFAFYILVLSGIPCNADDDCCIDEIAATSNKPSTDNDHKPMSPCAPLFACGAYHGVTIPDITIELPKAVRPFIVTRYFYKEQALSDFSTSIWQPPKTV